MAINAATMWEIRTTGAGLNGGGFADLNPGTSIDYSQQNAAQLALTDLATNLAGTTLTSATGGFTAAMAGNTMYITAAGTMTAGFYQITGYTNTNTVTIDRSAGASKAGGSGKVGGAWKINDGVNLSTFYGSTNKAPGNTVWVQGGSYTMEASSTVLGTMNVPLVGYGSVRGDRPTGDTRPLINSGTNYISPYQGTNFYHLRFTGTGTRVVYCDNRAQSCTNCKFTNTSATAGRAALELNSVEDGFVDSCEAVSDNGTAIFGASGGNVFNCFIHDSVTGIGVLSGTVILGCAISRCTTGIGISTGIGQKILQNVIYGCTTGISGGAVGPGPIVVVNNILSGNTTGLSVTSTAGTDVIDYNCWNNTTDVVNIAKGPHDVTADPLLVDPANDDYRLAAGSPCFAAGMQLSSEVGLA